MSETVAELLDYACEGAEARAAGRKFSRPAKREIREAYRTVAAHVSAHGGFKGRFWKRFGAVIDAQLAVLGKTAASRQGKSDEMIGVAATRAGIKTAVQDCPIC